MKHQQAARRYAKMLYHSVGTDGVPGAIEELGTVARLMAENRGFRGLLENPRFTAGEREKVLLELAGRLGLSDGTVRFILHLADELLIAALPEVTRIVTAMYLERTKRARAVVETPVETGGRYDAALKAALRRLSGREVEIDYVVDPGLLGGIRVKVGSTMYDSSIQGQLRLLKDDLMKG